MSNIIEPSSRNNDVNNNASNGDGLHSDSSLNDKRLAIYHTLVENFNRDELATLSWKLGIRFEDLPAQTQSGQARELVKRAEALNFLEKLQEAIKQELLEIRRNDVFDPVTLVPEPVKQKIADSLKEMAVDQSNRYPGHVPASTQILMRSDEHLKQTVNAGLARGFSRFVHYYEIADEDMVAVVLRDPDIFKNRDVQATLLETLSDPISEQQELGTSVPIQSFAGVLPGRKSRERVNRAILYLLVCLCAELIETARENRLLPANNTAFAAVIPNVFHNLPQPDYGRFVGREAELTKLHEILRPYPHSQFSVATVDGIGGVGKSALALEVAQFYLRERHTLSKEERFQAIIWVSAKQSYLTTEGIRNRPQSLRTLDDIYTAIAITLERPDISQAEPSEQHALVRAILSRQRTLIVIDNLETVDDESVVAFLYELPAPTKAIVTTRHRIDIAYPIRLLGMPESDAKVLMQQTCTTKQVSRVEDHYQRLYDRTGGVPLAIVWSIALIGEGYGIDAVLERLGDASSDVSHFCFESIMTLISNQPSYKLLMALSICLTDASREALGEITELPPMDRDCGLVKLEKLSLVNKQSNRFSLLPLTKVYTRAKLRENLELEQRVWRLWLDHLKQLSQGAGFELNWYTSEYAVSADGPNILEAMEWAYQFGSSEDVYALTAGASTYLDSIGNWNEILNVFDRAAKLARLSGDQKTIARFSVPLSWIYRQRGDYEKSQQIAVEGLHIYESLGNLVGEAHLLQSLGASVRKLKEFERSASLSLKALSIAEQLENADLVALIKTELGKLARDQGDWETAWSYFQNVKKWTEESVEQSPRDHSLALGVYGQLAYIAYKTNRFEEAKNLCLVSLDFFGQFGTKGYYATLKLRLALTEEALGNADASLTHLDEAIYWLNHLGMKPDLEDAIELRERLRQVDSTPSSTSP